jgi:putative FmdB family regulatory protein
METTEESMPVYQFSCKGCNKSFQVTKSLQEYEKGKVACPKCGSKKVEQRVAAFFAVTSKKS